jgi:hypothetical protein
MWTRTIATKLKNRLIDYLLFYVPLKNFFNDMKTSPLPVKGCKILPHVRLLGPLSREGSLSCTHTVIRDLGFSGLTRRTAPFSRILRRAWRCRGPILTWILTGWKIDGWTPNHFVACINKYDKPLSKCSRLSIEDSEPHPLIWTKAITR